MHYMYVHTYIVHIITFMKAKCVYLGMHLLETTERTCVHNSTCHVYSTNKCKFCNKFEDLFYTYYMLMYMYKK